MNSSNLARLNTAILVVKGAVVGALGISNGRSVHRITTGGSLVFGNITNPPTEDQQDEIQRSIESVVSENAKVETFDCDRSAAESKYGDAIFDENGIPGTVKIVRLVFIRNWTVASCTKAYAGSTSDIAMPKEVRVTYNEEKKTLHVSISIESQTENAASITVHHGPGGAIGEESLPDLQDLLNPRARELSDQAVECSPDDTIVTPWVVAAGAHGIDYDKLIHKFGCQKISEELIKRIESVTGQNAHRFIRRGLFFAHRDLEAICEAKEKNKPFYLYTGRGPASDALHVGHLIPFIINKWLQDAFDVPLVIQMSDDEKFLFKEGQTLEHYRHLTNENAKDILAMGFDPSKTFIFSDLDYIRELYPTILKIQKKTTLSQAKGIFGFVESDSIGKIAYPATQAAPSFPSCFPGIFGNNPPPETRCLIPCAIDQDPYFRMTRDLAPRLGWQKPCLLLSKFIPALQGSHTKMSGSVSSTAILVTDDRATIKDKIYKHAFSGGGATVEEHRKHGANLTVDVAYQYLTFFLESDEELADIGNQYANGELLSGEIKRKLTSVLTNLIEEHQRSRALITDAHVQEVMDPYRPCLQLFA